MKEFEKNSILILILTMLANIINYIFQIVMGRMLDVGVFGTFISLLSLHTVISVPVATIVMVVSKKVSEYNTLGKPDKPLIKSAFYYTLLFTAFLVVPGIALSPLIDSVMHIGNKVLVAFVVFSAGSGFIVPVATGGLQGEKRFMALGLVGLTIPMTKLTGGVIFVLIGLELYGIFLSITLGNILTVLIGLRILKINILEHEEKTDTGYRLEAMKLIGASFMVNLGWIVLTNMDVLIIRHYFTTEETGLYSVAGVLGKMILYISNALVMVMFPLVSEAAARKDDGRQILRKALLYSGCVSLLCAAGLNIFNKPIISILFGMRYTDAATYIFPVSIWIVLVSFIIVLVNYTLASGKAKFMAYTLPIGCFFGFIITLFINYDILHIIYTLTAISFIILIVNCVQLIYHGKREC